MTSEDILFIGTCIVLAGGLASGRIEAFVASVIIVLVIVAATYV